MIFWINYFLEIGARTHKIRVYKRTEHSKEMIGYLLVRGHAYLGRWKWQLG